MMRRRRTRPHVSRRGTLVVDSGATLCEGPVRTHVIVQPEARLRIGAHTVVDFGCGIACESQIDIGADVRIGPFVQILDTAFHQVSSHLERPQASSVTIGDGAVIGAWSMVLPGAVIEPGTVIAPGSVVTARR